MLLFFFSVTLVKKICILYLFYFPFIASILFLWNKTRTRHGLVKLKCKILSVSWLSIKLSRKKRNRKICCIYKGLKRNTKNQYQMHWLIFFTSAFILMLHMSNFILMLETCCGNQDVCSISVTKDASTVCSRYIWFHKSPFCTCTRNSQWVLIKYHV